MGIRLGMEAKLYYRVGGVDAPGPWTELSNVRDVTLNLETGEADVTTRGNAGWRATVATLKEGTVEFEMVWDSSDPGFSAVKAAFFSNTVIGLEVLDGERGGPDVQGLRADFSVTSFSRSEPLEEAIKASVSLKVSYSTTPPQWIEPGGVRAAARGEGPDE